MVTGLQAAGKTTVGRLLAERLPAPSASFDGDVLYNMVAAGGADMTPSPSDEALRQVRLRYEAAALIAQHYVNAGFDFVYSDIVLGSYVTRWMDSILGAERHLVVLTPSVDAIVAREIRRGRNSYRDWREPGGSLADAVRTMSGALDETPRRGLWLDTSDETPTHTVDRILADDMRASLYW
jgi:hypothetical protein